MPTKKNLTIEKQLKICILGGGNIGTLLIGDLGLNQDVSIRLFTSSPDIWNHEINVYDAEENFKYTGKIDIISNNPKDVITDADMIISTLPSHVFPEVINKISPFIKSSTWIGVMPGSGGSEFYCKNLIDNGNTLFGFQRVHGIARIKEYGKSVYDLGKKKELHIATIPGGRSNDVCIVMERLFRIKCHALTNFLNVTLTPSNPILHTTRLYSLFYNYIEGMYWHDKMPFYSEWTDKASNLLIACDEELQSLCKRFRGLDLSNITSLKEHYDSGTPEELTNKIKSINAFKGIMAPMVETAKGYIPDFNSRYFKEDFPYGLCIIKGFCEISGVDTPNINKVLMWFEKISNSNFFVDGKFNGKDLQKLPLPNNYGLNSIDDVILFYGNK